MAERLRLANAFKRGALDVADQLITRGFRREGK
jgi:hypothetical protein